MADGTHIEWARHPKTGKGATWNIVTGCSVLSPGCTNCYAMKLAGTRLKHHPSREGLTRDSKAGPVWNGNVRFNEQWLTQPLQWTTSRGIFVAAHGDLFADGITDEQLDRIFAVMALCPQHIFFVLTKRPERMRQYLSFAGSDTHADRRNRIAWQASIDVMNQWHPDWKTEGIDGPHRSRAIAAGASWPLPNVWLGVSVEDQKRADERRDHLRALAIRGWTTFVSYEPAIGPVDWFGWSFLHWMISGGESGLHARATHPDWHRAARNYCAAIDIPYFFKQWGNWTPAPWKPERFDGESDYAFRTRAEAEGASHAIKCFDGYVHEPNHKPWSIERGTIDDYWAGIRRTDKKSAGHLLDGVEHLAMPEIRT